MTYSDGLTARVLLHTAIRAPLRGGAWGAAPSALRSAFRPASFAFGSVQPVPREAAHSGCTPGLADGQGFSAALRCAETQAHGRKDQ
jgi:hypothetical protein